MYRCSGNPDIVLWNRPYLLPQALLQASVFPSDIEIARDNGPAGREPLHLRCVLGGSSRLRGAEEQLADRTAGMYTSGAWSRWDSTVSSPYSKAMTMLVSSKNLPLAGIDPLAPFLNRLRHLPGRYGVERG
jgi:hypothetical protein